MIPIISPIDMQFEDIEQYDLILSDDPFVISELGSQVSVRKVLADPYTGTYTVEPSREEQILQTSDKLLLENIVIQPIPSNYGLVTWNGSTLMIS